MAGTFNGTTSVLKNAVAPITTVPFSVGFWAMFTTAGTAAGLFCFTNPATAGDYFAVRKDATNKLFIRAIAATVSADQTITTADAVNTWFYVVARFISATNRRMAVLHADGLIEHVQSTISKTPSGVSEVVIGAIDNSSGTGAFWPGLIAELWYTDKDIQADGGQLSNDTLRQLAYNGPYPLPHVDMSIAEYHAMRSALPNQPKVEEIDYEGRFGVQTWTNTAVTAGPHPPLYPNYQKPALSPRPLVMI